jgi:hypothetical protein
MSDLIRREDALRAVHDALVVNPRRDEARKLAGYVISALPAVTVQAQIDEERARHAEIVARLEAKIRYYERRENWRARETN